MLEIEDLAVDLPRRAADAVLSITAGKSRALRRALAGRLGSPAGSPGSLVAEPILEGAHPWLLHPGGWDALLRSLHPHTGQILQSRLGYPPYAHQVQTWALAAAPEPASVIISSGTGSGKTECFLGALLNHLLNASDGGTRTLTGVRGLMLYPLNALINSQQERLSNWLAPFGGKLRYCLYNGLTPEGPSAESDRRKSPEQVLDRKTLRANPPPLLVTNLTMLEYMLVRRQDAPILQQSQGLLEYIVLDEVHTYVGAQATELALLLRRVALAFGRDPRKIRVIVTSATLGTGERGDQKAQLRQFLRDLTGAERGTVHAIIGERAPLHLPPQKTGHHIDVPDLQPLSGADAWEQLAPRLPLQEVTRRLHGGERIRWSDWRRIARDTLAPGASLDEGARALLAACARARHPHHGSLLLPARMHIFVRTLSGLWACCAPACRERPVDPADWRFGKIFFDHRDVCDACGAPVLEIWVCQACGTEILAAEEVDAGDGTGLRLRAPMPEAADDDFSLDIELPDSGEEPQAQPLPTPALRNARWILPALAPRTVRLPVRRRTGEIVDVPAPDALLLSAQDADFGGPCPACGEKGHVNPIVRPFRVGAPFILGAGLPIALGAVSSDQAAIDKPFSGRRLLTFTDARQGTARLSAKLQADAERLLACVCLSRRAGQAAPRPHGRNRETACYRHRT
jgi:DEAD/DEAH box helicase domain-containing protein